MKTPYMVVERRTRQMVSTLGLPTPVPGLLLTDPLAAEARSGGKVCVTHEHTGTLVALLPDAETAARFVLALADMDWSIASAKELVVANPGIAARVRELKASFEVTA